MAIKLGYEGPEVQTVRAALKARGYEAPYSPRNVNLFDVWMDGVVRDFQRKSRLVADGIVGPATWAALTGKPQAPATTPGPNAAPANPSTQLVTQAQDVPVAGGAGGGSGSGLPVMPLALGAAAVIAYFAFKGKGEGALDGFAEDDAPSAPRKSRTPEQRRKEQERRERPENVAKAKAAAEERYVQQRVAQELASALKRRNVDPSQAPGRVQAIERELRRGIERELELDKAVAGGQMLRHRPTGGPGRYQQRSEVYALRRGMTERGGARVPEVRLSTRERGIETHMTPSEEQAWVDEAETYHYERGEDRNVIVDPDRYPTGLPKHPTPQDYKRLREAKQYQKDMEQEARTLAEQHGVTVKLITPNSRVMYEARPAKTAHLRGFDGFDGFDGVKLKMPARKKRRSFRDFNDALSEKLMLDTAAAAKAGQCQKAVKTFFRLPPLVRTEGERATLAVAEKAVRKHCGPELRERRAEILEWQPEEHARSRALLETDVRELSSQEKNWLTAMMLDARGVLRRPTKKHEEFFKVDGKRMRLTARNIKRVDDPFTRHELLQKLDKLTAAQSDEARLNPHRLESEKGKLRKPKRRSTPKSTTVLIRRAGRAGVFTRDVETGKARQTWHAESGTPSLRMDRRSKAYKAHQIKLAEERRAGDRRTREAKQRELLAQLRAEAAAAARAVSPRVKPATRLKAAKRREYVPDLDFDLRRSRRRR